MSWSAIAPTPVNAEQAIELLSNTRNPNISDYFFLGTYEQPILRCYNNNPNRWLNKFFNHINSGILDCWLRESTIFNALSEYDHMFELASPPGPYHVPKVHLSARLLDQVSHMRKNSLVFFFVVRGLACPQTKLIIKYTLRHTILAMIDEAMQGFSTEFCGAMLRSVGLEFFAPTTRRKDWKLVPVDELAENSDRLEKVWTDGPDSMAGARPMIEFLCWATTEMTLLYTKFRYRVLCKSILPE